MSLASAQRNLAKANRKALKVQGESKMGQSLIGSAAEGLQMGMAVGDSMFGITENKKAWKDYEAGQEYMDLDKSEPLTLRQKLFKKPEDIYSDNVRVGNKEYTSKEIQSVGALARSDNKALYEKMMDGNLASSLGTPYSSISPTAPDPGTTGLFNYDDTGTRNTMKNVPLEAKKYMGKGLGSVSGGLTNKKGFFQGTSPQDRMYGMESLSSSSMSDKNELSWQQVQSGGGSLDKGLSTNKAIVKALRDINPSREGKTLSEMIPNWSQLDSDARIQALESEGINPRDIIARM